MTIDRALQATTLFIGQGVGGGRAVYDRLDFQHRGGAISGMEQVAGYWPAWR